MVELGVESETKGLLGSESVIRISLIKVYFNSSLVILRVKVLCDSVSYCL